MMNGTVQVEEIEEQRQIPWTKELTEILLLLVISKSPHTLSSHDSNIKWQEINENFYDHEKSIGFKHLKNSDTLRGHRKLKDKLHRVISNVSKDLEQDKLSGKYGNVNNRIYQLAQVKI